MSEQHAAYAGTSQHTTERVSGYPDVGQEANAQAGGMEPEPQVLLVLVGLPGSGKSTFAQALVNSPRAGASEAPNFQAAGISRQWIRASQDDAPSRRRQECEDIVRQGLSRGQNVVVDRVNFDSAQRAHFVRIGETHPAKPRVWSLVFETSMGTLRDRLRTRLDHPTIPDEATGIRVLGQMGTLWSPPNPAVPEGFDKVLYLTENDQPVGGVWTADQVDGVLDRIAREGKEESGERIPIVRPNGGMGFNSRGRGYGEDWSRGARGRGGGDGWRGEYGGRGRGYWNEGYARQAYEPYRHYQPYQPQTQQYGGGRNNGIQGEHYARQPYQQENGYMDRGYRGRPTATDGGPLRGGYRGHHGSIL